MLLQVNCRKTPNASIVIEYKNKDFLGFGELRKEQKTAGKVSTAVSRCVVSLLNSIMGHLWVKGLRRLRVLIPRAAI